MLEYHPRRLDNEIRSADWSVMAAALQMTGDRDTSQANSGSDVSNLS